jgi:hypothetical protein
MRAKQREEREKGKISERSNVLQMPMGLIITAILALRQSGYMIWEKD